MYTSTLEDETVSSQLLAYSLPRFSCMQSKEGYIPVLYGSAVLVRVIYRNPTYCNTTSGISRSSPPPHMAATASADVRRQGTIEALQSAIKQKRAERLALQATHDRQSAQAMAKWQQDMDELCMERMNIGVRHAALKRSMPPAPHMGRTSVERRFDREASISPRVQGLTLLSERMTDSLDTVTSLIASSSPTHIETPRRVSERSCSSTCNGVHGDTGAALTYTPHLALQMPYYPPRFPRGRSDLSPRLGSHFAAQAGPILEAGTQAGHWSMEGDGWARIEEHAERGNTWRLGSRRVA